MFVSKSFKFDGKTAMGAYSGSYEEPTVCPLCKHAIKPEELGVFQFKDDNDLWSICAIYLCKSCYQPFVTLHSCKIPVGTSRYESRLVYVEPQRFTEETFDEPVENLSPQFVKIYNQAFAAETRGLDEIAGLGYRKAMEFLVKDYCIHINPEDEEKIKSLPLSKCITTYVKNEQIQTLATRAAWIGNDEAHYIRKQEDRDVSDMKNFIKAMVYFVGMVLIAEDAASMSPA